ncbi:MAG: hypothetical protein COW71_13485 [Ignavibacteriales bacterium CG18_big_fil_WC_8_21_14_2_50_31_20]|nr:MAG: hypothetical protein COW71_13485 [Ignavibacteriales bacterium CG18_big_fil_WC_8_21_14_2_50_31_20]
MLICLVSLIGCENKKSNRIEIIERIAISNQNLLEYNVTSTCPLHYIILHHSALKEQPGIKIIEYYHTQKFGYDDIGYHFIIEKDGSIYEGRSIKYMGAHAGQTKEANQLADSIREGKSNLLIKEALKLDPDYGAIGICLDGNFNLYEPNSEQLNSLKLLLRQLKKEYSIENGNILMHAEVKSKIIEKRGLTFIGKETVCPGIFAYKVIREIIHSL